METFLRAAAELAADGTAGHGRGARARLPARDRDGGSRAVGGLSDQPRGRRTASATSPAAPASSTAPPASAIQPGCRGPKLGAGAHAGVDATRAVGVHDHDRPVAVLDVPGHRLGAFAVGRGDPDGLGGGCRGRGAGRAGLGAVDGAERLEVEVRHRRVRRAAQIGGGVLVRAMPTKTGLSLREETWSRTCP